MADLFLNDTLYRSPSCQEPQLGTGRPLYKDGVTRKNFFVFHPIKSWMVAQQNDQVLFLTYEKMKANLRDAVDLINKFLKCERTPEEIDILMERFTVSYMQRAKKEYSIQ